MWLLGLNKSQTGFFSIIRNETERATPDARFPDNHGVRRQDDHQDRQRGRPERRGRAESRFSVQENPEKGFARRKRSGVATSR